MIGVDKRGRFGIIPMGFLQPPSLPLRHAPEDIDDLVRSIRKFGLLHPILVRAAGRRYEIVCGYRRYLACRRLRMGEIPAVIRKLGETEALEIRLTENVRRVGFTSAERDEVLEYLQRRYPTRTRAELERSVGAPEGEEEEVEATPIVSPTTPTLVITPTADTSEIRQTVPTPPPKPITEPTIFLSADDPSEVPTPKGEHETTIMNLPEPEAMEVPPSFSELPIPNAGHDTTMIGYPAVPPEEELSEVPEPETPHDTTVLGVPKTLAEPETEPPPPKHPSPTRIDELLSGAAQPDILEEEAKEEEDLESPEKEKPSDPEDPIG